MVPTLCLSMAACVCVSVLKKYFVLVLLQEMLFQRTCLMINYEDTIRALDKAKPQKKQAVCTYILTFTYFYKSLRIVEVEAIRLLKTERKRSERQTLN